MSALDTAERIIAQRDARILSLEAELRAAKGDVARGIELSPPQGKYRDDYQQGAYDARFAVDRVMDYTDYHKRQAYMDGYRHGSVREWLIEMKHRIAAIPQSAQPLSSKEPSK